MILFSIHIYILFIILVKTKITIALPPKPLNATYSEHIIAVEMGYDDLLVTNDLSELFGDKDLLHDQEYHDEYVLELLDKDPSYNPHLSLMEEDFSIHLKDLHLLSRSNKNSLLFRNI